MIYYRYETTRWSDQTLALVGIHCDVVGVTKRGVWVSVYGMRRFVLDDARKRYAYPTKEQALESFYARKDRQIRILQARLTEAQTARTLNPVDRMTAYVPY